MIVKTTPMKNSVQQLRQVQFVWEANTNAVVANAFQNRSNVIHMSIV